MPPSREGPLIGNPIARGRRSGGRSVALSSRSVGRSVSFSLAATCVRGSPRWFPPHPDLGGFRVSLVPSGSRSAGLPGFPGAPALPFLLTGRGCARTYYPASARWRRLVQQSVSERFPDWGKSDKTCFITISSYFSTAGLSGRIPAPLAVLRAPATPPPRRTAGRAPSPERGSNARSLPGRANRVADRPFRPPGRRSWPAARR